MPAPSLSELMQYVSASQQNPFLDTYIQTQQRNQENAYKQAQMDKIIQDMKMAEMMAPYEQRVKGATADQLAAQAAESTQRTAVSQGINTPEALAAQAAMPELNRQMLDYNVTSAGLKKGEESIKYNESLRKQKWLNDFMLAENEDQRLELANQDPALWESLRKMANTLQQTRINAAPSSKPTDYQTIVGAVRRTNPNFSEQQVMEEAARIYSGRAPAGQPSEMTSGMVGVTADGREVPTTSPEAVSWRRKTTKSGAPSSQQPVPQQKGPIDYRTILGQ